MASLDIGHAADGRVATPGVPRRPIASAPVFGDRKAVVVGVRPWEVHGVPYIDVTVGYDDGTSEVARLGTESVPEGVAVGDRVAVVRAVNMIVSIRRL